MLVTERSTPPAPITSAARLYHPVTPICYDNYGGGLRDRRRLVRTVPAEDVIMYYDTWIPPLFSGRDVAVAWILAALLFLGFAISM